MKKIILCIVLLSIGVITVYATATIAKDRKSQILPWQGSPESWYYDPAHDVGESFQAEARFNFVNGTSKRSDVLVEDSVTGLMWESTPSYISKNWEESKAYCSNLEKGGYDDWRLPSIMELSTIIDYSKNYPAVDTTFFTLSNDPYWSNITNTSNIAEAGVIIFNFGGDNWHNKNYTNRFICVR